LGTTAGWVEARIFAATSAALLRAAGLSVISLLVVGGLSMPEREEDEAREERDMLAREIEGEE
jgi:hypothetical protein